MFGGRAIGGPKLAPTVSPGKTRSGAIAGVVGAAVAAPLFVHFALRPAGIHLSLAQAVAFGVILSLVGQVGDLAESLLKREVGVKDSSALIPGHGGVLDRFDSLYFVVPVAAALYRLFGIL
jgi:phosphatidate cytidylyltransferase